MANNIVANEANRGCLPRLPDAVMEEYVWPWVHQMRMRASLNRIVRAGPSLYEDLPDLVPADETWLSSPTSVLTDADGTVLIVDFSNMRIRELTAEGTIETRVGIGEHAYSEIGADRLETPLENPIDAAYGPDGLLYLAPLHEGRVIRVGAHDTIEVVAGTGEIADGVHGGATLETPMGYVAGIAFGPDGSLYAADQTFSRVRRVGPDGRVECVLGLGQAGENGVGAGPETALAYPERIVVDAPRSRLLVADAGNHRVLAMDLDSSYHPHLLW